MKSIIIAALCGIVSTGIAEKRAPDVEPPYPAAITADVGGTLSFMTDGSVRTNHFKRIETMEGLEAILSRKTMKKLEKRVVAQRMENGNIMSVYDDDSVGTSSVSVVTMTQSTKDKVAELIADRNTLQAAKSLAAKLKTKETKDVADADVLGAVSDSDTDTISAAIVGALVGVATGVGIGGVKKKTTKGG